MEADSERGGRDRGGIERTDAHAKFDVELRVGSRPDGPIDLFLVGPDAGAVSTTSDERRHSIGHLLERRLVPPGACVSMVARRFTVHQVPVYV